VGFIFVLKKYKDIYTLIDPFSVKMNKKNKEYEDPIIEDLALDITDYAELMRSKTKR
jgi:hypothetical protein